MRNWDNERSALVKYIEEKKLSYESIGRIYGCTGANIKKMAKRLGIKIEKRRSINPSEALSWRKPTVRICRNCKCEFSKKSGKVFCSKDCSSKWRTKKALEDWISGRRTDFKQFTCPQFIRRYLFKINDSKCEVCKWGLVNEFTQKVPLQVHHIDGDCMNNKLENLQLLCPNCHSLTENFGSRNKNANGCRSSYYGRAKAKDD